MFSVNTGEPPTPPNSTATTSPRSDPNAGDVAFRPANQSQDSGYDPSSPFSLHEGPRDSASTHFFTEDDVFDDCEDDVLLDADVEEEEDKERCPNCDTALPCICGRSGSSATDCTYTYFTASSSNCDSSSSDASSLSIRPSSMPIFIPRSCQNTHSNSNQRLPCSESSSAEINPSTSRPRMLTDFIFNNSHPGSLPAAVISFRNYMSPPLSFAARMARYFHRNPSRTPRMSAPIVSSSSTGPSSTDPNRNHRRRICSEGSSLGLTPEEGHPAARDAAGSCPNEALPAMGEEAHQQRRREQLPDLVLHASPVLPRRSRSQSINLPPDVDQELVQSVGRELRRLSEDFEMSIEIRRLRLRQQSLRSTFRKSS